MRISDWSSDVCSSDLFTYIPVGFEGRSAVVNPALGSALLANAGQQTTEPGPGATEGLVFGDRFPLSIGNERQNLSLSTRGDITDWLAVYASGSYSRYQVSSLVSSLPSSVTLPGTSPLGRAHV